MNNGKDQFYTKPIIATQCFSIANDFIEILNIEKPFYVEPSAGTGSFYNLMPKDRRLGLDIEPKCNGVIKQDYLVFNLTSIKQPAVVIGNPPFGKMNKLTTAFVNISAYYADLIAFIVPATFHRYHYAKRLKAQLRLISVTELPDDSFYKPDGSDYKIPCQFLVWSKKLGSFTDLRERELGATIHPDFEMIFLSGSKDPKFERKKVPNHRGKQFSFGTMAQGYIGSKHVGIIEESLTKVTPDRNWLLFYTNDPEVKQRLLSIDFKALYNKYEFIHSGFGKVDVVEEYSKKYKPKNKIMKQLSIFGD